MKSVDEFTPNRIVIGFLKNRVEIIGKDLSIGKYCEGDLHILGEIVLVAVLREGENV